MATQLRRPQDDLIEWHFVLDYAALGLLMNFRSLVVLLRAARSIPNDLNRKSICLSAWQALLSSYEDFALLLHAILNKKNGRHLHCSLGVERQRRQGSTLVPSILKHYRSTRVFLDNLGFTSLDLVAVRRFGLDIPDQQTFDLYYQDFADGVRAIGDYQIEYNDPKNRLKHGKAIFSENGAPKITFLTWDDNGELSRTHIETTLRQIEVAVKQTAKIYLRSLDFLLCFMIQYHPTRVADFQRIMRKQGRMCVRKVRALGLKSEGLTSF